MNNVVSTLEPDRLRSIETRTMELTRCEFCDESLNSDFDVARHIASKEHKEKLGLHRENLRRNHSNHRDPKRNFREVLQLVKVRNETEIDTLADREFFKVKTDSMASVSESLAQVLLKSLVEYELRNFDPATRDALMLALSGESVPDTQQNSDSEEDYSVFKRAGSQDDPDTTSGVNIGTQSSRYDEYMPAFISQPSQPTVKSEYEPSPSIAETDLPLEPPKPPAKRKQKEKLPVDVASEPRPDPTSTYTPQLAKIKIEPKDD